MRILLIFRTKGYERRDRMVYKGLIPSEDEHTKGQQEKEPHSLSTIFITTQMCQAPQLPKMRVSGIIMAAVSTLSLASTIPTASLVKLASRADPADDPRGSYTVSGLGARKQEVTGAGADALALAVAMLQTDDMSTTYVYGDSKQDDMMPLTSVFLSRTGEC